MKNALLFVLIVLKIIEIAWYGLLLFIGFVMAYIGYRLVYVMCEEVIKELLK